jgi:CHAT domain-containing protein
MLPNEVAVWVIRDGKLTLRRVPADRNSLNAQIRDFRVMIQRRDLLADVQAAARQLDAVLVAPIADLIRDSAAVGIVPHRGLHYLSFAALYDGSGFLAERYPLFYAPSASVLVRNLQSGAARPQTAEARRRLKVLAVGNPAVGSPAYDLPFSEKEVESLALQLVDMVTLRTGKEATEEWLKQHIGEFDVIHLAAHAHFDSVNPLFSSVLLAPSEPEGSDGVLELHEVSGLRINAQLVVLSACQSGVGDLRSGDELVSLSRAFLYAGTRSIVSTLWRVDDVATALICKHFYREYAGRQFAAPAAPEAALPGRAAALCAAQLRVMNDGEHYHPVYWAGMVLTGDYR